ncbi:MAG: MTH938/NDUFAF3 family protein [archaeon]
MFVWTSFGKVKYKDTVYDCDIWVNLKGDVEIRDRSLAEKKFGTSHYVCAEELEPHLEKGVKVFVFGNGQTGVAKLTDDAIELLAKKKIEVLQYETPKAIKVYNEIAPHKKTIALIHVTC